MNKDRKQEGNELNENIYVEIEKIKAKLTE